jgi:two-component system NtrC family sensor kinase
MTAISPDSRLVGILAAVSSRLNADVRPDEALQDAVDAIRAGTSAERVALWVREPAGTGYACLASPWVAGLRAAAYEYIPPLAPGAPRAPMRHAGDLVGMIEVKGGEIELGTPLLPLLAGLLAPFCAAVELAENLAMEVAARARELETQRLLTNLVIDQLPVGLYVVDRDYRIVLWNRQREVGAQGARRRDVIGRSVFEVLTRQDRTTLQAQFDHVFATGETQQAEVEVPGIAESRWFRNTKVPLRLEGGAITHVISIGEDVTEWKAVQGQILQSEKLAAIGQLAAGVMHEINNPLATIAACAVALQGRVDDLDAAAGQPLREYCEMIEGEVERCTGIVNGLLDFSRPKSAVRGPVGIGALVDDTLKLLRHHERFRQLTVTSEVDDALPSALGNREQLVQVLLALMLNAIDAMDPGGRLTVRGYRHALHGDEVVVEVEDTGHGIPRERVSKIFEPFYTTKPPGRGTGLGLSICYGIVEAHRGRLEVDSLSGRGSTFRVVLPVAAEARA